MLRITAGEYRGRLIQAPNHLKTRPTQAKLRQAWFNSIQAYLPEARILDLFAGSGALGFEGLSRGASHVLFVESHRATAQLIRTNGSQLKCLDRMRILEGDVARVWKEIEASGPFDLVLADPPYEEGWEMKLLESDWSAVLAPGGLLCIEWGVQKSKLKKGAPEATLPEQVGFLAKVREKTYGDSVLTHYERT